MQDPDPQPSGWAKWKPHQSVVGGNTIGATIAVLVVPFLIPLYPAGIDHDSITVAFSAFCTFCCCYFIPDSRS